MKIVHIVSTPNGAPWMTALAREQKRSGHDVSAILPSLGGTTGSELARHGIEAHAAPVSILSTKGALARTRELLTLVRLLRRLRPDVVHSHIFESVITSRLASWLADVPIHLSGNVHPLSLESELMRVFEIGTAFCDTRTIASCTYTRDLYIQLGVPKDQVELIFYAVDQSMHDPELADRSALRNEIGVGPETPVVGKIAYFYPPARNDRSVPPILHGRGLKGHDVLIRAIPFVLDAMPEARFVLVGRGWGPDGEAYQKSLEQLAIDLGIREAVHFIGERSDIPNLLAAFDVSVHCSLSDNLAGTVESLLMKRPMVVSDIPGFKDTVLQEQTGLVVPKDDPQALAAAIIRLLRDRELAQRLGAAGRERMLSHFMLTHTFQRTEQMLSPLDGRATNHYRLRVTLARLVLAPLRLLPMYLQFRRLWRAGS